MHFWLLWFWHTIHFKDNCDPLGLAIVDDLKSWLVLRELGEHFFPAVQLSTFHIGSVHPFSQPLGGQPASAKLIPILQCLDPASRGQWMLTYTILAFPPPASKILINFSFKSGKNQLSRLLSLGNKQKKPTKPKQVLLDKMKSLVHLMDTANPRLYQGFNVYGALREKNHFSNRAIFNFIL